MNCTLCPRNCNTDRSHGSGFCGTQGITLARIAPHMWEEPCISGSRGSGTVFFAGCNLRCRFCQNYDITVKPHGVQISAQRLADVFLYLNDSGVANINLVTASHVANLVAQALELAKPKLTIPVVYNTSSYERVTALKQLDGLVDVYLPDLKFCSPAVSQKLCNASNYFEVATAAVCEMYRQQPHNLFDADGYITKGVIIRHLVLPGFAEDSKQVLDWISHLDKNAYVSVMSQYFPARHDNLYPQLNRRLYRHEYQNVVQYFFNVGLTNGFMQGEDSATRDYLPTFCDGDVSELLRQIPCVFSQNG